MSIITAVYSQENKKQEQGPNINDVVLGSLLVFQIYSDGHRPLDLVSNGSGRETSTSV